MNIRGQILQNWPRQFPLGPYMISEKELAMEEKLLPTSRQKKSGSHGQGAEKRPGFQMPDTRRGRYYSDG